MRKQSELDRPELGVLRIDPHSVGKLEYDRYARSRHLLTQRYGTVSHYMTRYTEMISCQVPERPTQNAPDYSERRQSVIPTLWALWLTESCNWGV